MEFCKRGRKDRGKELGPKATPPKTALGLFLEESYEGK